MTERIYDNAVQNPWEDSPQTVDPHDTEPEPPVDSDLTKGVK